MFFAFLCCMLLQISQSSWSVRVAIYWEGVFNSEQHNSADILHRLNKYAKIENIVERVTE